MTDKLYEYFECHVLDLLGVNNSASHESEHLGNNGFFFSGVPFKSFARWAKV